MAHKENGLKPAGHKIKHTYPAPLLYPDSEDIYNRSYEEQETDPADITKNKQPVISENDAPGSGLDVPGSELDDEQENTGSEDEENNYYSIGGDDHNDLEEDNGE